MEGFGRFADDFLVYRQGKDRAAIENSVHEELERIRNWCLENKGHSSLNNHAVHAEMPTISVGENTPRESRH